MAVSDLPEAARVVIVGGGIMGCSTAYHLAELGCTEVIIVERSKLTSGTTWHSAAQVRALRSSVSLTQLARYSGTLYSRLAEETGQQTGWRQCGSLSIAANPDRLTHILRQASLARAFGIEVHEVDRAEVAKLWPLANTEDIIGGVYSPSDGRVNPSDTCAALIKSAKSRGVRVFEDTPVTGIKIANARVCGVETEHGDVACETVVTCSGLWSRQVGLMAGVAVPLHACEHYALITKPIDGMSASTPILGDHDGCLYIREEVGGLLAGSFEPDAKPVTLEDLPVGFSFDLLEEDWDHFEPMMRNALHRVPALETAEVRVLLNGPESFTADNNFMLGESAELGGFFVGCGMNSVGMASGGGAGKALAEWVVNGEPTLDLSVVDIRRFPHFRNNLRAVRERAAETLSIHYAISYPGREPETVRHVRGLGLHAQHVAAGAHFGERTGWERPSFYANGSIDTKLTFAKPGWFESVAAECKATREAVALYDQSPFGKLVVEGADALTVLHRVCANDVDVEPGRVVYSPILNRRGGYESDVVILRSAEQTFMMITGAAQTSRDAHWIRRYTDQAERMSLTDVTSNWNVIAIMGPRAREVLRRVTNADVSNSGFPYLSHRAIEIGYANALAVRISYVGELGWEIYVSADMTQHVYEQLMDAGNDLGIRHAGTFAQTSLRIEKAYLSWGHDIGPADTPLEAGMSFAVKTDKQIPFIGREALVEQRKSGVTRRRICLALDDPDLQLQGGEPIVIDEKIEGYTTSAAYAHSLGRAVAIGYIQTSRYTAREHLERGSFEVEIAGTRHAAKASLRAFFDPKGERLRS